MDKFCRKCGHSLDEETGFCPNCEQELLREARQYLSGDDDKTVFIRPEEAGVVQETSAQKWRQDILDEAPPIVSETQNGWGAPGERVDRQMDNSVSNGAASDRGDDSRSPKKTKALPIVLSALVIILAGVGTMWFLVGGDDDDGQIADSTNATTEATMEPQTESGNEKVWLTSEYTIKRGKNQDGQDVVGNQLILRSDDVYVYDTLEHVAKKYGASVVGRNDYDRAILLQWSDDQIDEKSIDEWKMDMEEDSGGEDYEVDYNYRSKSCEVKRTDDEDLPKSHQDGWNIEIIEAEKLKDAVEKDAVEKNGVDGLNIGYVYPSVENNGYEVSKGIIEDIVPDSRYRFVRSDLVKFFEKSDNIFALTAQLTDLVLERECRIICCPFSLPREGANDELMQRCLNNLDENVDEDCLICFPEANQTDASDLWEGKRYINGISVGIVGREESGDGEYSYRCSTGLNADVTAPDYPIEFGDNYYDGDFTFAVAHVAGFAADVLCLDSNWSAEECKNAMKSSAETDEKNGITKMINGKNLVHELNGTADEEQNEGVSEKTTTEETDSDWTDRDANEL